MSLRSISATFVLTLALGAFGCLDEGAAPELGTATSEVYVDQLEGMGYSCFVRHDDETKIDCTMCYVDSLCRSGYRCTTAECNNDGTQSCIQVSDRCFLAAYGAGQNHWFEAEDARRWAPMVVGGSVNASGGGYVTVPVGAGAASNFRYVLSAQERVPLYAWARVQVPNAVGPGDTSVSMDNAIGWSVQLPTTGSAWKWVPLADAATGEHRSFDTTAGDHQFRMYIEPKGIRIDRVVLADSPTFEPYSEMFEAEAMGVYGSMVKVIPQATTWTNPGYVWVPNGAAGDGQTQASIFVPKAGQYSVWGRVKAPTSADNAFGISTDFGPQLTWSMPVTGNTWAWHQVKAIGTADPKLFQLSPSFTTIEFFRRDDGTKLDRYLVTNDPGFLPANAPLVTVAP